MDKVKEINYERTERFLLEQIANRTPFLAGDVNVLIEDEKITVSIGGSASIEFLTPTGVKPIETNFLINEITETLNDYIDSGMGFSIGDLVLFDPKKRINHFEKYPRSTAPKKETIGFIVDLEVSHRMHAKVKWINNKTEGVSLHDLRTLSHLENK